jgi:hypothetical protein
MRVNTKIVVDIETGTVLERESFNYHGPVERCDPATIALVSLISSLAIGGTELGLNIANKPGTPKPPGPPPQGVTALQNVATLNAERAAIGQQTPNVIGATSGLANPEYVAQISQLLAGTAGQSGSRGAAADAIAKAFGLPPGVIGGGAPPPGRQASSTTNFKPAGVDANPNPSSTPTNLSDFLNSFLYK